MISTECRESAVATVTLDGDRIKTPQKKQNTDIPFLQQSTTKTEVLPPFSLAFFGLILIKKKKIPSNIKDNMTDCLF